MPFLSSNKDKSRYVLKEKLGTGGMGVVYRAFDSVINADVALKTLHDITDPVALRLFREECDKLAKIVHPNVVEIRDVGEIEDGGTRKPYLVMPFLRGRTLDTLILESPGGLPLDRAIEILVQACRGLQATHDAGLIHRDIKPSNIFVLEDDSVKLIDFGVAHYAENLLTLTRKGTLMYMAPEQVTMRGISPLSDIFSLGVVAYETLSGRRPFEGKTEKELVDTILHRNPPPASRFNPHLNTAIDQTLQKALAKLPEARFQSARELADTLRKAAMNQPITLFDPVRIEERLEQARNATAREDFDLAGDILKQLEQQGYLDDRIASARQEFERMRDQRSITSLLASARTRIDAYEYGLAAEKIEEVFRIDPRNAQAEALRDEIERKRTEFSARQLTDEARGCLSEREFERAKQLIEEALAIRPNEPDAIQLRSEIQRREHEYNRLVDEKRRLTRQAQQALQNSAPDRALELIGRAMELEERAPDTEANAAELRRLDERIREAAGSASKALTEARALYESGDFRGALERCDQMLVRFPGHALFRALKLDIENADRQRTAQLIAQTERRLAAESDLGRQVEILREAAEQYPDVPLFKSRHQAALQKHQFVESLIERARLAEKEGRIADAVAEWKIVQSVYPEHPQLASEIARLEQQKGMQADRELRESLLQQIRQALQASEFEGALHLLNTAARDFAADREFSELRIAAESGVEWDRRTGKYLEQVERLTKSRQYDEALELLDKARRLDVRVKELAAARHRVLLEKGRSLLEKDTRKAQEVLEEALELAPRNQTTQKLLQKARERNRKERTTAVGDRIRRLETLQDYNGALQAAEEALEQDPGNHELRDTVGRLRLHRNRLSDAPRTASEALPFDAPAEAPPASPVPSESRGFFAGAWERASGLGRRDRLQTVAEGNGGVVLTDKPATSSGELGAPAAMSPSAATAGTSAPRRIKLPLVIFLGAMVITAVILALVARQRPRTHIVVGQAPATSSSARLEVHVTPAQAELQVDGARAALNGGALQLPAGPHQIEARLPGYKTFSQSVSVAAGQNAPLAITLSPLAPAIRIETDFPSGSVLVDDKPAGTVEGGQFSLDAPQGSHVLGVADPGGARYFFPFTLDGNGVFAVEAPRTAAYGTPVVATLASAGAHIVCGRPGLAVALDNAAPAPCTRTALDLPALAPGDHKLAFSDGTRSIGERTISYQGAPLLSALVITGAQMGGLVLEANQDGFQVSVNGYSYQRPAESGHWRRLFKPGDYKVTVSKPGFTATPETFTLTVKANADAKQQISFVPVPVLATLRLHSQPGAEVSLNGNPAGTVPDSGILELKKISAGNVDLRVRKKGFGDAHQSTTLTAGDNTRNMPLQPLPAHVTVSVDPPDAVISYTADGDSTSHSISGTALDLPAGSYRFEASAPGHTSDSTAVTLAAGESKNVALHLAKTAAPVVLDTWPGWDSQDGWMVRDKPGPILRSIPQDGARVSFQARWQRQKSLMHWFGGSLIVVFRSADGNRSVTFHINEHNVSWSALDSGDRKDGKFSVNLGKNPANIVADVRANGVRLTLNGSPLQPVGPDLTAGKALFGFQVEPDQIVHVRDVHVARAAQ